MESDSINSDKQSNGDFKQEKNSDPLPGNMPISKSSGIRRAVCNSNEDDRELLGYGYNILLWCSLFSWAIFLFFRN